MLEAGQAAPDFTLPDQDGKTARVLPKVSPKTHDDILLEALAELV